MVVINSYGGRRRCKGRQRVGLGATFKRCMIGWGQTHPGLGICLCSCNIPHVVSPVPPWMNTAISSHVQPQHDIVYNFHIYTHELHMGIHGTQSAQVHARKSSPNGYVKRSATTFCRHTCGVNTLGYHRRLSLSLGCRKSRNVA